MGGQTQSSSRPSLPTSSSTRRLRSLHAQAHTSSTPIHGQMATFRSSDPLGWVLGWFWFVHGHYTEGLRWLEQLLRQSNSVPPLLHAGVLARAGTLAHFARHSEFGPPADLMHASLP